VAVTTARGALDDDRKTARERQATAGVAVALRAIIAMSRLLILGATGSLGRHVLQQALAAGHVVTAFVRTPSKLPPEVRERVSVHAGDLGAVVPPDLVRGQDALINCAGHVADGKAFVGPVDRLVTCVDVLRPSEQPVCWFLAGAALLDIDSSGRRGVDLPQVESTYWPHRANLERLSRSRLDWRLLCPGPMVDQPALGLDRLRISLDVLPVEIPDGAGGEPGTSLLPVFTSLIPQMTVPYADAAALMLANLDRGNAMSGRRVGLALPVGMRGRKLQ
jgi:putative NADH-flavin reductase